MKDSLSLISPEHILNDKSYGNITEFALRTEAVRAYLCNSGAESKLCDGGGSDYDVLRQLVECIKRNGDESSRVYRYFHRMLQNSFEIDLDDIVSGKIAVDELWHTTSDALLKRENSLSAIISRSKLDSLGVAAAPWDYEELPEKIGGTAITSVLCPLGTRTKSILEIPGFDDFSMLENHIRQLAATSGDCAIFLDDTYLEFEKPNLYAASLAYDKIKNGSPLKDNERKILKSQLLRDVLFSFGKEGKELMLVLPDASNIKIMFQTEQLLDYIDESVDFDIKITLFAPDAVGLSFAYATAAKRYKKITAEAAIGGVDCYLINESEIKYWGVGGLPDKTASLSATPAPFGKIIC